MSRIIPKPLPNHGNLVWQVSVDPEVEPITVDQVKDWGKIETTAEDDVITTLIVAIREVAEAWLGRALIEQRIVSTLDYWPDGPLQLPRPPLIAVVSIVTLDQDDTETTYDSDNYFVRTDVEPGQIHIKNGASPPINTNRYYGGFKITHRSGYGDEVTDVPQALKQGLIEWVLDALENRQIDREPPNMALPILGRYKLRKI